MPLLVRALRGTTQLEVSYIDTNNDTPMAWAYLADRLASTYGADPQFAAVLAAMKTTLGTTWGDYDRRLAANASLLPAARVIRPSSTACSTCSTDASRRRWALPSAAGSTPRPWAGRWQVNGSARR